MFKKINNLFVKGQQTVSIISAFTNVFVVLLVTITALYGLGFAFTWILMLVENPATLHAPALATFDDSIFTSILALQPAETMAFWELSIKLQGLIIAFLGAASYYVASYAGEWLLMVIKMYSSSAVTNNIVTAVRNKWQPLINAGRTMWSRVFDTMRKIALYIMFTTATTAIVYFIWNVLTADCPM